MTFVLSTTFMKRIRSSVKRSRKANIKNNCQVFDLAYIAPLDIEYFLEDYLISDFGGSAAFVETSRRFFRKFLSWAYEKDYLDPEHYSEFAEIVGNIRKKGKRLLLRFRNLAVCSAIM